MNALDFESLLRVVLPNVSALLLISALLGSAIVAEWTSRCDHPSDRHRVLSLAIVASLGTIALGIFLRLLLSDAWVGDLLSMPWMLATIGLAWLLGSIVFAFRLLIGSLSVKRIMDAGQLISAADLAAAAASSRARARLGMVYRPLVYFSPKCDSPFVHGVLRPVVLLPESLREAETAELPMVLTHEFAHIRRLDYISEFTLQLLGTLCWWNPLFWIASARLRTLRELACDRAVVSGMTSRVHYARLLVRYASDAALPLSHAFSYVRMADRATLSKRVRLLLAEEQTTWVWSPWTLSHRATCFIVVSIVALMTMLDAGGVAIAYDVIDEIATDIGAWSGQDWDRLETTRTSDW